VLPAWIAPINRAKSSLPAPTNSPGCRAPRTNRAEGFNCPLVVPNGLAPVWVVRPVPAPNVRVPAESVPPTERVPNSPVWLLVLLRTWAPAFSAAPQVQSTTRPNATLKVAFMAAPD